MSPKGLHVIRVTDVSLLVEWEGVKHAEYYLLSYYPYGNEGAFQEIRVPKTENSYFITGLKPGVTYIVQVQAVIKGISSESDRITATTGKEHLYPVSCSLFGPFGIVRVKLTWAIIGF